MPLAILFQVGIALRAVTALQMRRGHPMPASAGWQMRLLCVSGIQTWSAFHRFVAHNFSSPGALVGWASVPRPHQGWPCAQAPGARPLPDVAATIASLVAAREAAESAPCLRGGRARHFRGELRRGLARSAMLRSRRRARLVSRGRAMPGRAPRVGIVGRFARRVIQDIGKRQQRISERGGVRQDATPKHAA